MPAHENIRRRRQDLGLSLQQLSERLVGSLPVMSAKVLSKIETGRRKVNADELPHFAVALQCSADDLLDRPKP